MAELICRTLRDGGLEGEHAPALTIKDTRDSPHGCHVFNHVLSQLSSSVLAGKSQSKAIVVVSYLRSPKFYLDLLERRGIDVSSSSSQKWIKFLDCYTDPLGWKQRHQVDEPGNNVEASREGSGLVRVLTDVRNLDNCSLVIEEGKGLVGQAKVRFSVAIDSVSEMLRHSSILKVAGMLSNLRSHDQVSSTFWLLHSDLHEVKVESALEYMSSMIATIEPAVPCTNEQRGDQANFSLLEKNFGKGKITVRFKRRNGRVRIMQEAFHINQSGISFSPVESGGANVNQLVPKVQFNLELSEKERKERANVILPFEHQGNGQSIQIYDGRRSLLEEKNNASNTPSDNPQKMKDTGEGEIIYFRDSDDEMPDSDEDPDDDLDI